MRYETVNDKLVLSTTCICDGETQASTSKTLTCQTVYNQTKSKVSDCNLSAISISVIILSR